MTYHREGGVWWADSDELPGFSAAAESCKALHEVVREGVRFHLGDEPVAVRAFDESGAALDVESLIARDAQAWWVVAAAVSSGAASTFARKVQHASSVSAPLALA